jgi:uridine kinase
MDSSDGARIYRRSLIFLLEMAFVDLYPGAKLTIDHSVASGGFYCQVTGMGELNKEQLSEVKQHLRKMVDQDMPFERTRIPLEQAVEQFKKLGYDDKVALFDHRKKDYLTMYHLGGRIMDYMHGYMVPSTGYLQWFDITAVEGGFTLHFPRRTSPTKVKETLYYPKLLKTFRQYGDWLSKLGIDNVGSLNNAIKAGRAHEIVLVSEALHEQNISELARQIAQKNSQIILISGPSSSGKTTSSRRLAIQLLALGISPYPLELDNYFLERTKTPIGADGKPDFEALNALDLPLLAQHLESLLAGNKTALPRYNFKTGLREIGDEIQLKKGQPVILEGIHGMNPRLIPDHLAGSAFRIYVSALTQLNLDRHNRVSTTDTRLLRRITRDARERGYSAIQTISRWDAVRHGEKEHIFPYQENADVMFNSALVYELSALKPLVEPLLRQVPFGTHEYIEAKRLLAFLDWFLPINITLIPENSIVREFLGDSILKDFKIWK